MRYQIPCCCAMFNSFSHADDGEMRKFKLFEKYVSSVMLEMSELAWWEISAVNKQQEGAAVESWEMWCKFRLICEECKPGRGVWINFDLLLNQFPCRRKFRQFFSSCVKTLSTRARGVLCSLTKKRRRQFQLRIMHENKSTRRKPTTTQVDGQRRVLK